MTRQTTQIIEFFEHATFRDDWKTKYIRYRIGRTRHQYWLWNRKRNKNYLVDEYDYRILKNCQPGHTVFFASSGYYLKDIWPEITVVEQLPVVKTFYPDVLICPVAQPLVTVLPNQCDNFAVINNRADYWVDLDGLTQHVMGYATVMRPGCRFFYSFRDTQIHVNRLKVDMYQHFLNWAKSLSSRGFELVWHDIQFPRQLPDSDGIHPCRENPDVTNGNIKFWFVYQGQGWDPVQ